MESLSFFLKGAKFSGKIYTKTSISIETQIDSDIIAINSVIVEKNAIINGDIVASSVICSGQINGNIQSSDFTKISCTGKVFGNINSTNLIIERGGGILGECRVNQVSLDA